MIEGNSTVGDVVETDIRSNSKGCLRRLKRCTVVTESVGKNILFSCAINFWKVLLYTDPRFACQTFEVEQILASNNLVKQIEPLDNNREDD